MNKNLVKLIKGGRVYSPASLGIKDILIGGGKILAVSDHIDINLDTVEIVNAEGMVVIPGLIDAHVHIAGAGGEGGPSTRTPELQLTDYTTAHRGGRVNNFVKCLECGHIFWVKGAHDSQWL